MTAIGSHLWMLKSLGGNTQDYIVMAHSAQIDGRTFEVPPNCSVNFAVLKGSPLTMPEGPVSFFRDRALSGRREIADPRQAGQSAPDLALGKLLGHHWRTNPNGRSDYDYMELYLHMAANLSWQPNVLLIRHRNPLIGREVYLSYVVAQILRRSMTVPVNFYVWGCRGIEQISEWRLGSRHFQTADT
jgi:hypothetical protein